MNAWKLEKSEILFVLFLAALSVMSRLVPHPWNFTAIGAMALFSGFSVRTSRWPMLVTFLSLVISDMIIGPYEGMVYVYGGFLIAMLISAGYFRRAISLSFGQRAMSVAALSLVSSFVFFLVTNFGAWKSNPIYTQDFSGLMTSFAAGLPFLFNQMGGDWFYGAIIFGVYEILVAPKQTPQSNLA
ncbi:MAG: hypothetical protein JNL11_19020 [Bdellovibrionaceae bacterium]|nr:hypothetical protein [Pseudobdellovibrionaceae bacterium]